MATSHEINAKDSRELLKLLAALDTTVPLRSEGRTKEHTQRYAITRLLSSLAETDRLPYPLSLISRDRPDFSLNNSIGIEHTEAVPQNEAHRDFLREHGHGPDVYFTIRAVPGEPKKSAKKLIEEIERNDLGSGWTEESVKRDWCQAILHFIEKKRNDLRSPGFESYPTQWLLIYDNWPGISALDLKDASAELLNLCRGKNAFDSFARIFIMSGSEISEVTENGVVFHTVKDIWKKQYEAIP